MKIYIALDPPHNWVTTSSKNLVCDVGTIEDLSTYRLPKNVDEVIGVARGNAIACHSVKIPGKRKRNAQSALAYALEDRLTDDIEDLHFKMLHWQPDDVTYAAVVSKQQMEGWVSQFRNFGIHLDAIVAEYMLLPIHPKNKITIAVQNDDNFCIRLNQYQGIALNKDEFDYWWNSVEKEESTFSVTDVDLARSLIASSSPGDMPDDMPGENHDDPARAITIGHWDIGETFIKWISNQSVSVDIDSISVLDGDYTPSHNTKNASLLKLAAMIAVLSLVGYWGVLSYELNTLEQRKSELNNEIRSVFGQHFPDEPYLDRPRSQLSNLINSARTGQIRYTAFQQFLNAVGDIVPQLNAEVEEVNFRENSMVVLCVVKDLSSLDVITKAFNDREGLEAELLSSGARDGKITGRFRLVRGV